MGYKYQFKINIRWDNKRQEVIYPNFFSDKRYGICVSKKQFDYLNSSNDIDRNRVFFDFKANKIYIHEWYEPTLTGDCDYAWPSSKDYFIKVFEKKILKAPDKNEKKEPKYHDPYYDAICNMDMQDFMESGFYFDEPF